MIKESPSERRDPPTKIIRPINPSTTLVIFLAISLVTFTLVIIELFVFDVPQLMRAFGLNLPVVILLVVFFGVFFLFYPLVQNRPRLINLLIGIQTIMLIALAWLTVKGTTEFNTLLMPLTVLAMFMLPWRNGLPWVVLFFFLTELTITYKYGFEEGVSAAAALGGFAAFAFVGYLVRRGTLAWYTIEALYNDLEVAHSQLTDYSKNVRRLAVSDERNRISREMHDSLGHSLTVAVVQLEGAERLIPKDPERAAGIIHNMRDQLKGALGELRQTLSTLQEGELPVEQTGNLAVALTELKQNFAEATGLDIDLSIPDNLPALNPDQRHALFRAAQEGLTNIQRHAQASHASVTLMANNGHTHLIVQDNGKGIPEERRDGRFGLRGLGERARMLNGSFEIENRPEGGAELKFTIPNNIQA